MNVRYVIMKERTPSGIGRQNQAFLERIQPHANIKIHRLHHTEFKIGGIERGGYLSMMLSKLAPLRKSDGELLHAGDISMTPLWSDPFDIIEIWDTIPFEEFHIYQPEYVSAFTVASYIPNVHHARKIVVHSEATRHEVERYFGRRDITHIPAGIDTSIFDIMPNVKKAPRSILVVASYYPRKNLIPFVMACALVSERLKSTGPTILRLIGDMRSIETVRAIKQIKDGHPHLHILQCGSVDESTLRYEYNRASILVSPSLSEGVGLTPIEALACGTLPVLSRIAAHGEMAPVAIFFDALDIEDMADRIIDGFNAVERDEIARPNFRQSVMSHDWNRVIERWTQLYQEISG